MHDLVFHISTFTVWFSLFVPQTTQTFNSTSMMSQSIQNLPIPKRKPIPLEKLFWGHYYEQSSAQNIWPQSWLQLLKLEFHTALKQDEDNEDILLMQLELFVYSWPNIEDGLSCVSHLDELGPLCDFDSVQHVAAMFLTQSFRKYLTWQQPEQYAILEARGLHKLASLIYYFYRCTNGFKGLCANPCKQVNPCGVIENAQPGSCIVVDPSATRGSAEYKYNAAWSFASLKCDCIPGYYWDDLRGICDKSSVCFNEEPCSQNGTERCEDLKATDFRCVCKHGYSGLYCDEVDMCVAEKLCEPNGVCVKVKTSHLGHRYICNCSFGYKDDPTSPGPDCTVNLRAFFSNKDYTPPLVYCVLIGCCVTALLVTVAIVQLEKRKTNIFDFAQKRLKSNTTGGSWKFLGKDGSDKQKKFLKRVKKCCKSCRNGSKSNQKKKKKEKTKSEAKRT